MEQRTETIPDPVQWHEGMLLAPQHFQLLTARYELLHARAAAGDHLPGWGVRFAVIDAGRLPAGEFRLVEADVVMPDGFQLRVDPEHDLRCDLTPLAEALRTRAMYVYLAVPASPALAATGELARFSSAECGPVRDETGQSEITVPVLRARVELWLGTSLPARLRGLPVARVQMRDEAFVLDRYQPPTAGLTADSWLSQECAAVVAEVRRKALLLAERLSNGSLAGEAAELWQTSLQVRSLAASLPGLEALLGSDAVHPQHLYLKTCDLAGHLASLSHGLVPPLFPRYDHLDPAASLLPVIRFVGQALQEGISERWHRSVMEFAGGEFRIQPDGWLNAALNVKDAAEPVLVVGLRGVPQAMERWCAEALISSASMRDELIDARALGASRRAIKHVDGLSQAAGLSLFVIEPGSAALPSGEDLVIAGSPAIHPAPTEAILYVRKLGGRPDAAMRRG